MGSTARLTPEQVRTLLDFNVESGELRWTSAASQGRLTNRIAGAMGNTGYRQIFIGRKGYLAHRLIWAIVHGEWPESDIDHIDGNRANNALTNLRLVTKAQNMQNLAVTGKKTASGLAGACYVPGGKRRRDRWEARIKVKGVVTYLGHFKSPEEAHQAYLGAKAQLHPYFSRASAQ